MSGSASGFGQRPFADAERSRISSTLRKAVGPEYLSQRAGPGGSKLLYISGNRVISLANEIFGFDGWSHSIVNSEIDFVDTAKDGTSVSLGVSTVVRVTLKDGTSHEDVGYGSIENARSKGAAFDKAKKESVTDGIKRALRSFGNVLGNSTYNHELTQKIFKIQKIPPAPFDAHTLYRGEDYADALKFNGPSAAPPMRNGSGPAGVHQQPIINNTSRNDNASKFDDDDDDAIFCGDLEAIDPAYLT
ncbi:Cell death protease, partial [Podochytrium sp. JEL0797]